MNRKNNIFGLTLIGALFMMVACSSSSSTTDDSGGSTNPPSDSGNVAILYTTTSDGAHTLEQSTVSIQTTPNMAPSTIQLDDSKTYQTMEQVRRLLADVAVAGENNNIYLSSGRTAQTTAGKENMAEDFVQDLPGPGLVTGFDSIEQLLLLGHRIVQQAWIDIGVVFQETDLFP